MTKGKKMKKITLLLVSLGMVGSVHATSSTTVWSNSVAVLDWNGALVSGSSTWIVRLYESADSTINFSNLLPTGDDTYTGYQFVFGVSGLADGFGKATINSSFNLSTGDKAYSVIFNSSDISTATRWAVIDGDGTTPTTVSYVAPSTFNYNPGGTVAGDWQAVPEPATALLFGIGGMGAWLIRHNKKLTAKQIDEDSAAH